MLFDDISSHALPALVEVPEGGMIYYLQFESLFRGRRHQSTFFCTFNGGEKSVVDFFTDMNTNIAYRLSMMQSASCFQFGYWFVKLFPPPYVVMFIPTLVPGFNLEAPCDVKQQAVVSFQTEQTGYKRWGRKFIYGMPASYVDGKNLTPYGDERIFIAIAPWFEIFAESFTDFPYTMGKMNRYVGHALHSPLNPINYWPSVRWFIRRRLVQHRHVNGRRPY